MLQTFYRLTIYVPVAEVSDRCGSGIASAKEVQKYLRIFRKYAFAGSVGTYNAVAEISEGIETFVPTKASSPTHGSADVPTDVVSARLVTYVPITIARKDLDILIEDIISAHPWEHPVLEVDHVELWMPS